MAKVDLQGGPRVVRGKVFVTRDVSRAVEQLAAEMHEGGPHQSGGREALICPLHRLPLDSTALSLQNIDTDQIIPAEYLTLVPSKV